MGDNDLELVSLRADIGVLHTMVDRARDNGAGPNDNYLRACAEMLYRRQKRLIELEARPNSPTQPSQFRPRRHAPSGRARTHWIPPSGGDSKDDPYPDE